MKWCTEVEVSPWQAPLTYAQSFFFLGSCFAEQLSRRLAARGFAVADNGWGTLFNPASIQGAMDRLREPRPFTAEEVVYNGEYCASFMHHSQYGRPTADQFLAEANAALQHAAEAWRRADVIFVTLGTARVYVRTQDPGRGGVVANCHKLPAREFAQKLLSPEEVAACLAPHIQARPQVRWVLTVSPIRHIADGAAANNQSKAALLWAVHRLCQDFPQAVYFPSYEFLLDELRDYRFYGPDLCHPSPEAADYIFQRFVEAAFSPQTQALMQEVEALQKALAHRPRFPESEAGRAWATRLAARVADFRRRHPEVRLP